MIDITQIKIEIGDTARTEEETLRILKEKAAKKLRVPTSAIASVTILRHAVDARRKGALCDVYSVRVGLSPVPEKATGKAAVMKIVKRAASRDVVPADHSHDSFAMPRGGGQGGRVAVVGSGPAGLFCAYTLSLHGFPVLLIERGKKVEERTGAVARFWEDGTLDEQTNVQFGEGGAGTFSDGKLYTASKDREGYFSRVLRVFVENGAPADILYEAAPHIGTDLLADVVRRMRERILSAGGEIRFETLVTGLVIKEEGGRRRVGGVLCGDEEIGASRVVLATGHSARDTFEMLAESGVRMEEKPFAAGLRIIHPQRFIDERMYGDPHPAHLPPASYKLQVRTNSGRSVYTFCMCPGGYVVNASSEHNALCVNGMSRRARDAACANSAVVCAVTPEDYAAYALHAGDVLSGMRFQRAMEASAFRMGEGRVPTQRLEAFLSQAVGYRAVSVSGLEAPSPQDAIKGESCPAPLHTLFPETLTNDLAEGIVLCGKKLQGFDAAGVLLAGAETRTSSPVRILRGTDLCADGIEGLYPCGEGAGYAGGIMSAAADGLRVARAVAGDKETFH